MTTVDTAPAPTGAPPAAAPRPRSALGELVEPVRLRLAAAVGLAAAGGVARVLGLVAAGLLVRALLDGGGARSAAAGWAIAVVVALVLAAVGERLASTVSHHAAFDHEGMVRRRLVTHLGALPLGTVGRIGAGGLKKVVQNDVRGLHAAVADAPPMAGTALGGTLAALVALGVVQWRLLLVVVALLPIVYLIMSVAMRDFESERDAYDREQEAIEAATVEYVQGMQEVRTFDGGSDSYGRFAERVTAFADRMRAWTIRSRPATIPARLLIAPLPALVLVAAAGTGFVAAGWVDGVQVLVALLLAPIPVSSVAPLMWMSEYLKKAGAAATRIVEVLAEPALPEPARPRLPAGGDVRFRGVTFRYGAERAPALVDVDLHVPAGSVCALVGPSGSGKSTIARLIPRFFDVDAGSVQVGGVDVREIETRRLLGHVALVFQEPFLLHASVRDNLVLGRPHATDAQLVAAARAAKVHDEVLTLPGGYDAVVGERGATLSGGQRQRLTIARALLSDAPVVVLDEATAFADPENEADIQDAIAALTRGRTVIVVAHRLSTIVGADQIVMLDAGRVAQRGTHTELLAAGGRYAALWDRHLAAQGWGLRRADSRTEASR